MIGPPLCRYNVFEGCPHAKTCTLILRGGAEQFIEETERSLHDAIMIVRRTIKNDAIVAGESQPWATLATYPMMCDGAMGRSVCPVGLFIIVCS